MSVSSLKIICAEADASWVPHFVQRMDHYHSHTRYFHQFGPFSKEPSELFFGNVYITFQDDRLAFELSHLMSEDRLLWANDYPHTDASWPHSQDILHSHAENISRETIPKITRDNVSSLYNLPISFS